ncbi:MAG: CHAT domain-containing protein [Acidobacteria bacterium]|jgi:CHAT domain-containing protein|nr:CHAT domain-containing protein [Acidobacteriota bacterium]
MNYSEIILAINEVLQAQSEQELKSVLSRHPELLKEETLMTIMSMTEHAKQSGQTEIAEALQVSLNKIAAFIQSTLTQQIPPIEPKVVWAIKARRHLALRKPELLDQAIAEAGNEHEIVRLLEAFKQSDFEKIAQLTEQIVPRLKQANRDEEVLTIKLINVDTLAAFVELFNQFPLEEQRHLREIGIQACQKALQIAEILQDKPCQAFYLRGLAFGFDSSRQLREAEYFYKEALQIYLKLIETESHIFIKNVAGVLDNLSAVLKNQRKFAEAEEFCREALKIHQELAEKQPHIFNRDLAINFLNLGNVQSRQRKLEDAENSYKEALKIYQMLAEKEPHIFLESIAATHENLGSTQSRQSNFADAEKSCKESLRIYRKLVETEPHIFLEKVAKSLQTLGTIQVYQVNSAKDSEVYLTEALQIYRKLAETEPHLFLQNVAGTLHNLGVAQLWQRNLVVAEIFFTESLQISRELAKTEPHLFLRDVAATLNNLGYLQLETNVEKAEKYYEEARKLVDELREKTVMFDERNQIMQENINVYDGLLACYIKKEEWQKVLEIAELGKSRSLVDLLNLKSEDLQPKAPTPDTLATVKDLGKRYSDAIRELQQLESIERYLSQELHQIEADKKQIEDDDSNDDETKLGLFTQIAERKQPLAHQKEEAEQKRFNLQSELKTVLAEIKKYDPDFPPKAIAIKPENIFGIAENLNRTIVMFRVLRQSTAIIFVFPDGKLQVEEVLNFGQKELLDLYIDKWLKPYKESGNDLHRWLRAIVEVLYEIDGKLIFKVREVLNDKTDVKDVLFVPNQSLALLPLHVACREENCKTRYFLEDYNVSYCPSVSVFKRCLENEKPRSEKTLGIITPTKDLARFNERQLKLLDDFNIEATKLSNDVATLHNVQTALKDDYGFIHFYCHGKYDEGNQFDSGLKMADKVLKLSEIMNNDLQTNWLTVLSACETGMVNAWSATDEHFGLPLGFVFAGSPSVWASLWSVSADTTSDLMQRAYQNLNKADYKNNKSEALRQAQLEMSQHENFSHPFYWAGFQHFGV